MFDPSKKTLVFDFGNVLIDLDFEGCFQYLERILEVDWSDRRLPEHIIKAIGQYDRGLIQDESMIWAFQQVNDKTEAREIVKAWNSLITTMPAKRLDMLVDLRKDYNIALLSNINSMHIDYALKYLKEEHGVDDFEVYFDHVFYSHMVGMHKPDVEIYNHVAKEMDVKPSDILFFDDMKVNIEGAKEAGWNAILHEPDKEILDEIEGYLEVGFNVV